MNKLTSLKTDIPFEVMAVKISCKKLVILGFISILIMSMYIIWLQFGSSYPPLEASEQVDDGIEHFNSIRFTDESAVVPFEAFTTEYRYTLDRRPSEVIAIPWLELEKSNIDTVIAHAVAQSKPVTGGAISVRNFRYGVGRHVPGVGEEYSLVFRTGADVFSARVYRKVGEPMVSVTRHERLRSQPLYVVMPLAGRTDRLQLFLDMLGKLIDDGDNVRLIVAAFPDGANGTRPAADSLRRWRHSARAHLVTESGTFSRGLGLMRGAAAAAAAAGEDDPLLFFCDVDMTFSADELEKCRVHAQRGRAVYYPIVFSRYNPRLSAALRQAAERRADVGRDRGDWRDYGFGMSCQYRSDFATVSGAYLDVSGWGGEDVALYRRFLARYRVVRAFDPDLQHDFHAKTCGDQLSAGQYRSCVTSKIENEGNKLQLGMLALSHAGELGPRAYTLFNVPWYQRPVGWAAIVLTILLAASVALNVRLHRRRLLSW